MEDQPIKLDPLVIKSASLYSVSLYRILTVFLIQQFHKYL